VSGGKDRATLIGPGAAACAACCAGPIIGFVAALGIGALAGALVFGVVGLIAPALVAGIVIRRRRLGRVPCAATQPASGSVIHVDPPRVRAER
jgi:hypothetical protein